MLDKQWNIKIFRKETCKDLGAVPEKVNQNELSFTLTDDLLNKHRTASRETNLVKFSFKGANYN